MPIYRDYKAPRELKPRAHHEQAMQIGWPEILGHWGLVVLDLSEVYGIHFETTDLTWPGLRERIVGLVSRESRLNSALSN